MPELPEVETIIRRLRAGEPTDEKSEAFPTPIGRTIRSAWGNWPNSIRPSIKTVTKDLPGHCIQSINRRGKYIVFQLFAAKPHAVRYLIIHLKMSGRLEVRKKGEPRHKHVHFSCRLDNEYFLDFNDARKFGRVHYVEDAATILQHLGPEPLAPQFTLRVFRKMIEGKAGRLKGLLLDQTFVAGLGNIYTDESLWRAKVHPCTRANQLTRQDVARLHKAITNSLRAGIRHNGAAIDWVYPAGGYQRFFRVYARTGRPCSRCGASIRKILVAQRGTHFCPVCQPF